MANGNDTTDRIYEGRQLPICGNGTIPDVTERPAKLEGVALAAGTYYYSMPTKGANEIDITFNPSAVSGVTDFLAYPTLRDGTTAKGSGTAGVAAVAGTQQTITLSDLRGVRICVLRISVATSTTFSVAEFSTL
jgi:hypothetical protein